MKSRVVPEKVGDRVVGVRLLGVRPGSVLAMIGLESGDRLETINGFSVATPTEALEAYARLRVAERLIVQITRNGRPLELDYTIR
jgi:general secretion pathway protein C